FQTESRKQYDSGTMEKSVLDISRSKNLFLNELLTRVDEHLSPNSIYEKRLQNLWNEFVTFCDLHNLVPRPAHPKTIMLFLTWMDILSRSMKPRMYLIAISRFHLKIGLPDPTTDYNVQMLTRKLMK